ncbi:MAG TPA: hypothetical protein VNN79_06920 [Actinomycetota bacterium]|nr:hypothetical protein [Actinomycetota bacterium]
MAGWRGDLERLVPSMEAMHPDLFHGISRAWLREEVERLEAAVPRLDDDQVMVGVMRIVASVSADGRDGHTGVFVWGTGTYPVHSLPLRVWLFPDGAYVVDALPAYQGLVGSRIDAVAGHPIAGVLAAIDPLVPRDNAETVVLVTPRFVLIPEVLHGLGLLTRVGPVALRLTESGGRTRTVDVDPVPMSEYNEWAGPYGLHLPPGPGPLSLRRTDELEWHERLGSSEYVQYNEVEPLSLGALRDLRRACARPGLERIVVDIRRNFGGETHESAPVARILEAAHGRGVRIVVITGRNTFSAASLFAARLERTTDATFVGEPMGGSPNLYGNSRDLELPYSGLDVSVATSSEVGSTPGDPRLSIEPDVRVELTSADYFAGRDPVLAAALRA